MTFIVASGAGPTDKQLAELSAQVDRLAASVDSGTLSGAVQDAVEKAVRPIAAEIALLEKEAGMRSGMLLNRRPPANDDFAGVDLNAAMTGNAHDAYVACTPNLHVANAIADRDAGARAARERLANTSDEFTGTDLNAQMDEQP